MFNAILTDGNRRAAYVRWSCRTLPALVALGVGLVIGLLTGVLSPSRLVLLGMLPGVAVGITAAVVALLLLCGTYRKPPRRPKSRPASVQRQFGIGPMLLLVTSYAVTFSVLRSLEALPEVYAFVATFLAAIILGQAFLFHGRHPRKASVVAGLIVAEPAVLFAIYSEFFHGSATGDLARLVITLFYASLLFAFLSSVAAVVAYLLGCLVSGIFLLRHRLDTGSWRLSTDGPAADPGDESPSEGTFGVATESEFVRRPGRLRRIAAAAVLLLAFLFLACYCWFALRCVTRQELLAAIQETTGAAAQRREYYYTILAQTQRLRSLFSPSDHLVLTQQSFTAIRDGRLPRDCLARLGHVDSVWLTNIVLLDESDLACLDGLSIGSLQAQDFMEMTDAALEHLRRLKIRSWLWLALRGPNLRDESLVPLTGMPQLHSLTLDSPQITDAALKHIASFPQLHRLQLDGTQITDAGLKHLQGLAQLSELRIHCPLVNGDGLQYLQSIPGLCILDLSNSPITDANLKHLARIPTLNVLSLDGTAVTDAGIQHLTKLPALTGLSLCRTKITPAGVRALSGAFVRCYITTDDNTIRGSPMPQLPGAGIPSTTTTPTPGAGQGGDTE